MHGDIWEEERMCASVNSGLLIFTWPSVASAAKGANVYMSNRGVQTFTNFEKFIYKILTDTAKAIGKLRAEHKLVNL